MRIGNAAWDQFQLDVYGETMSCLYTARKMGLGQVAEAWELPRALIENLEKLWQRPDEGIWEVRGGLRHFTHSKVEAWVAVDRMARLIEEFGMGGPEARKGDKVLVHYTGVLKDGTQFDSSRGREPLDFIIGAGQVIQGWEKGLVGMKVGGKRRLVIPPQLGYGARGAGNVIPPNPELIFEVELLKIK